MYTPNATAPVGHYKRKTRARTVDMHVAKLRTKRGMRGLLITVHRHGYMLAKPPERSPGRSRLNETQPLFSSTVE